MPMMPDDPLYRLPECLREILSGEETHDEAWLKVSAAMQDAHRKNKLRKADKLYRAFRRAFVPDEQSAYGVPGESPASDLDGKTRFFADLAAERGLIKRRRLNKRNKRKLVMTRSKYGPRLSAVVFWVVAHTRKKWLECSNRRKACVYRQTEQIAQDLGIGTDWVWRLIQIARHNRLLGAERVRHGLRLWVRRVELFEDFTDGAKLRRYDVEKAKVLGIDGAILFDFVAHYDGDGGCMRSPEGWAKLLPWLTPNAIDCELRSLVARGYLRCDTENCLSFGAAKRYLLGENNTFSTAKDAPSIHRLTSGCTGSPVDTPVDPVDTPVMSTKPYQLPRNCEASRSSNARESSRCGSTLRAERAGAVSPSVSWDEENSQPTEAKEKAMNEDTKDVNDSPTHTDASAVAGRKRFTRAKDVNDSPAQNVHGAKDVIHSPRRAGFPTEAQTMLDQLKAEETDLDETIARNPALAEAMRKLGLSSKDAAS